MTSLTPVAQADYLDTDPSLRGQNYVCLSFLSPEDVLKQKEHYFFSKFIANFADEMKELFSGLTTRYPKDEDNLRMLKERYTYLFDTDVVGEEYNYFVATQGQELQKIFDEKNDFKTSIRGIKVRGVFDTMREAQVRAEVLKKLDGKFHVYVAEVGCWCPWSPNPEEIQEQEFAETHLNTMMKHYKENQTKKDIFYEERKRELQFLKVKKDLETDTWAESRGEASTSAATPSIVFESSLEPEPVSVPLDATTVSEAAEVPLPPDSEETVLEVVEDIVSNVVVDSVESVESTHTVDESG